LWERTNMQTAAKSSSVSRSIDAMRSSRSCCSYRNAQVWAAQCCGASLWLMSPLLSFASAPVCYTNVHSDERSRLSSGCYNEYVAHPLVWLLFCCRHAQLLQEQHDAPSWLVRVAAAAAAAAALPAPVAEAVAAAARLATRDSLTVMLSARSCSC
jgi:hypothetical protein